MQEVIRQILEDKIQKEAMRKVLVEAYQKASIESAYLPPEDLVPPADFAGFPAPAKNSDAGTKKVQTLLTVFAAIRYLAAHSSPFSRPTADQ